MSMLEKYLLFRFWLIDTCSTNNPIGYLPKSISTLKEYDVDFIYFAIIDVDDENPDIIWASKI